MFLALSEYMQEKGLEWNPSLKMISDWEQVPLRYSLIFFLSIFFRLNVVHGKMSLLCHCMAVSSTWVIVVIVISVTLNLGQALWRKIQDLGIAVNYIESDKVILNILSSFICKLRCDCLFGTSLEWHAQV